MTAIAGKYITDAAVSNWPEGMSAADKRATIGQAEDLVERLTDDIFYSKPFTMKFDGNGKNRLFLGLIPDILTITEVQVSGIVLETTWWTYNKDSIYVDPEAVLGQSDELAELYLRMKQYQVLFPKGIGNVEVTGTYGGVTIQCPLAIKKAVAILCQASNDPAMYPGYSGFKSERIDTYTYTQRDVPLVDSGISEVDRLLKPFIRRRPTMGAV